MSRIKRILIVPSIRRGNGSGHIRRSIRLSQELIQRGAEAAILFDSAAEREHDCYSAGELSRFMPEDRAESPILLSEAVPSDWDLCLFDSRETSFERFADFSGETFTLGLDEDGSARNYFDYLIDILPNLATSGPNISSPGFLQLPVQPRPRSASENDRFRKILISFGGEDGGGLTEKLLDMIKDSGIFELEQLTVVKGPLFSEINIPSRVRVLDAPDNLASMLKEWDLVFTLFGLTCFEALYSRVPVVLFNPTSYHRKLALKAGIPEIGVGRPEKDKLYKLLREVWQLDRAVEKYSGITVLNLAGYILNLSIPGLNCRGCGRRHKTMIYRNRDCSFYRCSNCGLVNQMYFGDEKMDYGKDYFFDDYKKQYGRTYLEDFDRIKSDGFRRCRMIKKYKKLSSGALMDIGCGYGPFLAAASDSGFSVYGIDVSENAAQWVRTRLEYPAISAAAEDFSPQVFDRSGFDVITMWYVIEHLQDLQKVLLKINEMLPVGGVFAFATPNIEGITGRRSVKGFLNTNPLDHYTVWSPYSARRLLAEYGFRIKAVKCPVIHPERFLGGDGWHKLPAPLKKAAGVIIGAAGRLFRLGDTFEVYAIKMRDCGVLQ